MAQQTQGWAQRVLDEVKASDQPRGADAASLQNAKGFLAADVMAADERQNSWARQVLAEAKGYTEPSLAQRVASAGQGFGAGLAQGTKSILTDFPHAIGLGVANTVADVLGKERVDESSFQRDPATMIGRGLDAASQALTPSNPLLAGAAPFHYGETLGQVAPALASALLGPAGAVVGATQVGGQTGIDAARGGASGLGTLGATGAGYLAGGALSGGVAATLENISARGGGMLGRALSQIVPGAGVGASLPVMTNAIHNWATDDEIPLLQGTGEGALVGSALGGLVAMATEAALAKRARTGRRMTGQGWTGELLPEEHPITDAPDSAERQAYIDALIQGSQATTEQWLTDPRFAQQRSEVAQKEGAKLAEQHAALYADVPQGPEVQQVRGRAQPFKPDMGEPIYDQVTGAYLGNRELPPEVAPPFPDNRRNVPGKPRDIMVLPTEFEPVERAVYNPITGEMEVPSEAAKLREFQRKNPTGKPRDVMSLPPEQVEPGVGRYPESEYTPSMGKPRPKTAPFAPPGPEPGIAYQRDESIAYAPTLRPDYSKLSNPVTDAQGRTLVTDIGTDTNPSTGLRVTLTDEYKARGTMLRTDVVSAISTAAQKLGSFAIRHGLVPEGSSGLYDPLTKEARIATYGDIIAAAHEAGHAIETTVFGNDASPDRAPTWKLMEPELARLGRALYPDSTPANGHVSEGFAEFAKLWVLQHEDLMRLAPETTKWFDTTYLDSQPEFKASLMAAREAGDQYRFQGWQKRTQPIDTSSWSIRFRSSNLGALWHGIKRSWVESGEAIYAMQRAAADAGYIFEKGKRAIDVFVAKRATADSINSQFIHDETFNVGRERTGDSLKTVLYPIRGKRADFSNYLGLRAAQWRNEVKTRVDPETGERVLAAERIPFMSVDVAQGIAEFEAKNPHFRSTADAALAWYDRVLDYVGGHDPALAQAAKMLREDGEFYMPLHRWADWYEQQSGRTTGSKKAAATVKLSERSKGSTREILDPLTGLIVESRKMIERAHERAVQNVVIQNAVDAGLSGYVTNVTSKIKPTLAGDLPFKAGEPYGMPLSDWGALQAFSQGSIPSEDGPIVPYKRAITMPDGTPGFTLEYYQFDPKLHEAVMSMDPNAAMQAMGFLGTTLRFFKNSFVLGAVGLNASFLMLKNPIRDAQTLYVNSRNNPHLVSLIPQLAWEHAQVFAHQVTAGRLNYKWVDAYDKIGLDKSDFYATYSSASSTTRNLTRKGIARVLNVASPNDFIHLFAHVMQASEKATRIWELKGTAKKVGWEPGQPMTAQQAVAMAVDARQVTVDFTAGGTAAQTVNKIVPFFNVMVQGPRSYVRAGGESKSTFALRNAALMGMGALLWYRYKDEDWMQAMPADERMRSWFFPLGKNAEGENILARIPIAPEAALPVKAMEFFLDALHSKDPYTAGQYASALAQNLGPGGTNPIIDEVLRQSFNRQRMFSSQELVPDSLANKPVEQQIGPHTGPLSVWVGETFHISPVRADSAIRNTLGGVGNTMADSTLFGLLKRRQQKPETVSDTPLIGALTRKGGLVTLQSRNIDDLYTLAEAANRNAPSKPDSDSVRRKILLDNATKIVSLGSTILNTAQLTTSERQKLMSLINEQAKDAVEQIRGTGVVDPSKAIRARVQLQAQRTTAQQAMNSVGTGMPR